MRWMVLRENYGATFHNFTGITKGYPIDYIFLSQGINVLETTIFKDKFKRIYPSDY